jgi:cytidylate kinase
MAILTMSRQFGSGVKEIRESLSGSLGYAYVDKARLLNEIGLRGRKWEQWAEEFDQSSPSTWERYDWSFIGFAAILQSVMLCHAVGDNVILAGRGTNFLLEGIPHAYRIRFVAPMEQRIDRISVWKSVDRVSARQIATETDRERAGFIKSVYGKDLADPKHYDAVFDTGKTSGDVIVKIVTEELLSRSKLKSQDSQHLVEMRAAAAKVKAGLISDPELYIPTLKVEPTGGGLLLSGIVHNARQYNFIKDAALKLAGETPLEIDLRYRA